MYIFILFLMLRGSACCARPPLNSPDAAYAPVAFFKEEITLSVTDNVAQVSGTYYFRNNRESDLPFTVVFPFYIDSLSLYPHYISAYIINGKDTIPLELRPVKSRKAIALSIPMKPKGVTTWHLDYGQRILAPPARYILTTTSSWGKPLEDASYKFVVPLSFGAVQIWPEADSASIRGSNRVYWSHKANFMPRRDMEISWNEKKP
jgi:hypothetical protein